MTVCLILFSCCGIILTLLIFIGVLMLKSICVFLAMIFSTFSFADGFPIKQVSFNGINFTMNLSDVSREGYSCGFNKCEKNKKKDSVLFDSDKMKTIISKVDYKSTTKCSDIMSDIDQSITKKYELYQSYNHKALRAPNQVARVIQTTAGTVNLTVSCINNEYYDDVVTISTKMDYIGLPSKNFAASLN